MRRHAANLLAAVHAVGEVALFAVVLAGPLPWASAAMALVALPMLALGGRCWLTMVERAIRGRRVPSMTRRLLMWAGVGRAASRRVQWWVLGGALAWWALRVVWWITKGD